MKTLIINGSPRKNGDTSNMLKKVEEKLKGEIIKISAYYDNISACLDCHYCKTHNTCSISDDMGKVYEALKIVDFVIIASPVFFSELTGKIFDLASRFEVLYNNNRYKELPHKKGLLLLAGGGDGGAAPAIESAKRLFGAINAEYTDGIFSLNNDQIPVSENKKLLDEIAKKIELFNMKEDW